jgi:sporulation protein YlmC with PRC-barrel domain
MTTLQDVQTWRGMKVVDADGDKIGTIEDVFLDRHTGQPAWATVKTGLFGRKVTYVPIRDAEMAGDDEIRLPIQKEQVKEAPKLEPEGELTPEQERMLYEHYGRSDYGEWQGEDQTVDMDAGDDAPAIVGVRLRRVVLIAVAPEDDTD